MDGSNEQIQYQVYPDPVFDSIDEATSLSSGRNGKIQLTLTGRREEHFQ